MEEEDKSQDLAAQSLEESNFKVKFSRITTESEYEKYHTSVCEVCFQNNNKYFPENDEKGIKMMTCYGCSVKSHVYCYGIETPICEESLKAKPDLKVTYFLCQKCRIEPKKQVACAICNTKKGALKKLENSDEWIHVTCGLFSEGLVGVDSYTTMNFSKLSDKALEKDKKAKTVCQICKSNVAIKKCYFEQCTNHAHVYCTLKSISEAGQQEEGAEKGWCIRMNYQNNPIFDITSEHASYSKKLSSSDLLNQNLKDISLILDPTTASKVEESVEEKEQQTTKIPPAKKSSRTNKSKGSIENETSATTLAKATSTEEIKQLPSILQEIAASIAAKFNDQKDTTKGLEESSQQTKRQKKKPTKEGEVQEALATQTNPLLGGDLCLECETHRRITVYCLCQKAESSEDMVNCDLCNDWYHYSCVKYTEGQSDEYRCPMCDEWYAHKKKKLLKEYASGKAENFEIMVGNIPKLNLMDFISVVVFVDTRIHNMLFSAKKSNIDNQIKDTISILSFIPLISAKITDILVFKSRKYIVDALNEFLAAVMAQTQFVSIQSAISFNEEANQPQGYIINEEAFQHNENVKKIIEEISAYFQKNKMKEKGELMTLKRQIGWMNKAYLNIFKRSTEKISQSVLADLVKEEDETIKKWAEFTYIDQIMTQTRVQSVKIVSLFESTIQKANEIMETEEAENTSVTQKQQITEEEYIEKKYSLWRMKLAIKPSIDEFDQIIQEIRESFVDYSQELKKLESEREEIAIWFQTLDEQERNSTLQLSQKIKNEERISSKPDSKPEILAENNTKPSEKMEEEEATTEDQKVDSQKDNRIEEETNPVKEEKKTLITATSTQQDIQSRIQKNSFLMSKGDFEIFTQQMMTKIVPRIPRMAENITMLETYEKNELHWDKIVEYIAQRKAELPNPTQALVSELINECELRQILDSSLLLDMKVPYLNSVLSVLNELLAVKSSLSEVLKNPFDEEKIKAATESVPCYFMLEECGYLQIRLVQYKTISDLMENANALPTPDSLEAYLQWCKLGQFPEKMITYLEERLSVVNPIIECIKLALDNKIIETADLEVMKESLIQMKKVKFNFIKEIEIVRNLQKSDAWLRNLHRFAFNTKIEYVNQQPVVSVQNEIDLEVEETIEAKSVQECVSEIEEKQNALKTIPSLQKELINILREGLTILHNDIRIKTLLQQLCDAVWAQNTEIVLSSITDLDSQFIFETIYPSYQSAIYFKVSPDNPTFQRLSTLYEVALKQKQAQIEEMNRQQLEAAKRHQAQLELEEKERKARADELVRVIETESEDDENDDEDEEDSDEDDDDDDNSEQDEEDNSQENEGSEHSSDSGEGSAVFMDEDENDDDDDEDGDEGLNDKQKLRYAELIEAGKKWNEQVNTFLEVIDNNKKKSNEVEIDLENEENIIIDAKISEEDPLDIISFTQLKNTLQEGYKTIAELLGLARGVLFMKKNMLRLEEVIVSVHEYFLEVNKLRSNVDSIDDSKKVLDCIDVSDIIIEYRVNVSSNPETRLSLKSLVKMPYKNLHSFKLSFSPNAETTYFSKSNKDEHIVLETAADKRKQQEQLKKLKEKQKQAKNRLSESKNAKKTTTSTNSNSKSRKSSRQRQTKDIIELESQENNSESRSGVVQLRQKSNRRKGKTMDADFVYGSSFVKVNGQHSSTKDEINAGISTIKSKKNTLKSVRQLKREQSQSNDVSDDAHFARNQNNNNNNNSDSEVDDDGDSADLERHQRIEVVNDENRKATQETLRKIMSQNQVFVKSGANHFRNIENQMFGEFHKNRKKYLEKAAAYGKLFYNLNSYQFISKKIMAKNFQLTTLDKLIQSNLETLEKNLRLQLTQQQHQQLLQNSLATQQQQQQQQSQSTVTTNTAQQQAQKQSQQPLPSSTTTSTTSAINKPVSIGSAKEPPAVKKFKPVDPLALTNLITNPSVSTSSIKQQNISINPLSMLLSGKDTTTSASKESSSSHNHHHHSHSSSHRRHRDDRSSRDRDRDRGRDSSRSRSSRHESSRNNDSKRSSRHHRSDRHKSKNQDTFSDNSSYEEEDQKRKQTTSDAKSDGKNSIKGKTSPQRGENGSVGKFSLLESITKQTQVSTPKVTMNNDDCEEIESILNTYTSDHKVYKLEGIKNGLVNSQSKDLQKDSSVVQNLNQEFMFNPDEDEDGNVGDEEKPDIQELNKQYFDLEDEMQLKDQGDDLRILVENPQSKAADHHKENSPLKVTKPSSEMDIKPSAAPVLEDDPEIPSDSVIRVCKCRLKIHKSQPSLPAAMYTLDPVSQLKKFPMIDTQKSFDLFSSTDFNQTRSYLEKQVNKSIIILKGWIELQQPKNDSKRLIEIIKNQDQKEKMFGFKMNGMTFNFLTDHLITKTSLRFKPKHVNSDNQLTIPVIIYQKMVDTVSPPAKTNPYKFVKFCPNPQYLERKVEQKKKPQYYEEQQQQILSPIVSDVDEDDEIDDKKVTLSVLNTSATKKDIQQQTQEKKQQPNTNDPTDKVQAFSLKALEDIDLQSIQMQLQDIPTANNTTQQTQQQPQQPLSYDPNRPPERALPPHHLPPPPYHLGGYPQQQRIPSHYNQQNYGGPYGHQDHGTGASTGQYGYPPGYPGRPQQPILPGQHAPVGMNQNHNRYYGHQSAPTFVPPPPLQPPPPTAVTPQTTTAPAPSTVVASTGTALTAMAPPAPPITIAESNPVQNHQPQLQESTESQEQLVENKIDEEEDELNIDLDLEDIDLDFVTNILEKDPEQVDAVQSQESEGADKAAVSATASSPTNATVPGGIPYAPPNYGAPRTSEEQEQYYKLNQAAGQQSQQQQQPFPQYQPYPQYQKYPGQPNAPNQQAPTWDPQQNPQNYARGPGQQQQQQQKHYGYYPNQSRDMTQKNPQQQQYHNYPPGQYQQQNRNYQLNQNYAAGGHQNNNSYHDNRYPPKHTNPGYQVQYPHNQNQTSHSYQNKFQRNSGNPNMQQGVGSQNNMMNKQNPQFKNQFGSRQQAHYQRNNQPYTAHNPVPLTDQPDDRNSTQQQQTYPPQERNIGEREEANN